MTEAERIKVLAEALQICRGVLADIALSRDMDLETIRRKANRIYRETAKARAEPK